MSRRSRALPRSSISVMPPGPAKDAARDAAVAAARASSSRGHDCSIRSSWGGDLLRAGEYAAAWRVLTEAVTCYEAVPNDRRLSNALVSLGSLKRTHGQFDAALAAFERAVTVSRERNDPVGTVVALNAVATAQTDLWRTDEARASLEAALTLARERKMETLASYTVGQLGAHFTQIGQFAAAVPLLEESLARAATVPRQIERLTQLCAARARAAGAGVAGARAALPVCDRNVTLARGDSPIALLYALRARAEARRRSGALDEASADLREAIELVEDLRAKTVPIDFMKRGFSGWHEWLFGSSISVAVQQRDVSRALETAERARSRALLDLLATREVNAHSPAIANAAPTAPAQANVAAEASVAVAGIVAPAGAGLSPRGEAGIAPSGDAVAARSLGGGRRDVALPRLDSSAAVRAATVPDMIATARRLHSTLLVYWVNPDAVYIWTITPDGAIHDARVEVTMSKVIGLVAATRAPASQDPAVGLFALKAASSRRPWRELHDLLIAPIREHLPKSADALVTIVPHGPLAQLSFAALQDEQGRYLLERHTLHYTPAVGVLAYTARRQEERRRQTRTQSGEGGARRCGQRRGTARWRSRRTAGRHRRRAARRAAVGAARGDGSRGAPRQPRDRADRCAGVGNGSPRTSGRSLDPALRDARHRPRRRNARIVPGPARRDREAEHWLRRGTGASSDGRLTADEVYELELDADLVVLSACSSALGPTGTEGVIGFTRAFLYAGAASVIATSWNVPDASSYELMSRFYRERARRDTRRPPAPCAPPSSRRSRRCVKAR